MLSNPSPGLPAYRRPAHQALAAMSDLDREVLILRHGEGLANAEVAEVLGVEPDAASKRYGRAVRRLCEQLREMGILPYP